MEAYLNKNRSAHVTVADDTHESLSFPHQELHKEADAVQKHQPTPAAVAEQRPDMAEQMHAIIVAF